MTTQANVAEIQNSSVAQLLRDYKAKWNPDWACFDFPDGSHGNFGGHSSDLRGEPILRFREIS